MSTMWLLREVSIDWTINLTGDDHTIKFPSLHPLNFFIYAFSSNDSNHHLLLSHSIKMFLTSIYAPPPPITNIFINHPPNHCHISIDHLKSIPHLYMPPPPPLLPHLYIPPSLHLHLAIISCPPLPPITNTSLFAIAKAFISNYF